MKALDTEAEVLRREFQRVSNWDEWAQFVDCYFDWNVAPVRSEDETQGDLRRSPLIENGRVWEPFAGSYNICPDSELLFEQFSDDIFARLEPEAHAENLANPEMSAWKCVACRVFTRQRPPISCPFCGRPLVRMPLNET